MSRPGNSHRFLLGFGLCLLAACGSDSTGIGGPPAVASLAVVAPTTELMVGSTAPYVATVRDGAGNVLTDRTVTWASSNAAVATVSRTGLVTAIQADAQHVVITATSGTVGGSASLTVITPTLIAFDSRRDSTSERDVSHIYVMRADGSGVTCLSNDAGYFDFAPGWSPDGRKIAFTSERDGYEAVYVMNADGSDETRLTSSMQNNGGSAWSPDDRKIAFGSDRDGSREIYVMNADGSGQTRLTHNAVDEYDLTWSSDGRKIAFTNNGDLHIYVMNADGSGQTRLDAMGFHAVWSPDGKRIAFGHDGIYVMNADGSGQTRVSTTVYDAQPTWSPDGRKIAFYSERAGNGEIYVINADGSGETNLTNNVAGDYNPAWQP